MSFFLRNVLAVLLLQPAQFVEPHPRALRLSTLVSSGALLWLVPLFPLKTVIAYSILASACFWTGPSALSRSYGSRTWRAVFAIAWCTLATVTLSTMADSLFVDTLLAVYLIVGIKLQLRHPEPEICDQERALLRTVRDELATCDRGAIALTKGGFVRLLEMGPTIAQWHGQPIPEYLVDVLHRRWVLQGTTTAGMEVLREEELLLPPGAVYRLA